MVTKNETPSKVKQYADSNPGARYFQNVTFYTMGAFGADRVDCKDAVVREGVKYAQYNDAVEITFLEKGKRNHIRRTLSGSGRYLLVVEQKHAIGVPDPFVACDSGRQTKYATFDPRFQQEWDLLTKDLPALVKINNGLEY